MTYRYNRHLTATVAAALAAAMTGALLIGTPGVGAQIEQKVTTLMPQPEADAGWSWDIETALYTPETLFEYIDGEAELYIAYHFVEMAMGVHMLNEDLLASLTFDIYDMGTPLNAFGIYSSFRRPTLEFGEIGEEAIVSEMNLRFWKGRFYVQINAGTIDEAVVTAMHAHARRLADGIAGTPPPAELSWLPAENQLPRTLRCIATGFMGQEVFDNAMEAQYRLPGGECRAFVVRRDSPEAATAALATFRESLARQGQLPAGTEAPPDRLNADTAYYGRLAVRTRGPFVCGVTHFSAQDVVAADALLRSIVSRLENR